MEKIAIYGKGGIGKSIIASNLSIAFAKKGYRVLHVGCDPKHDSTLKLIGGNPVRTVIDMITNQDNVPLSDIIMKGIMNIDCIESGGPDPGVGCAGRGITRVFEILDENEIMKSGKYDIAVFDVLGDIVCGGFAAPLRIGYAEKVFIVVSEELMSLYAAENIHKAIKNYEYNGIYLGGLILNMRDNSSDIEHVKKTAEKLNSKIVASIPRSAKITEAEKESKTIIEKFPDSDISKIFMDLSDRILAIKKGENNG